MEEERKRVEKNALLLASRIKRWEKICPKEYRETQIERLPARLQALANSWLSDGRMGLGFSGPTGKCKTRCCYLILKRYHLEGFTVKSMSAAKFGKLVMNRFSDDRKERSMAIDELRKLETAHIILMDDLAKAKLTERVAEELFELFEIRTSEHRPILWTSNIDRGGLRHAMGPDKGPAFIRRIRQFTQIMKCKDDVWTVADQSDDDGV